MYDDTHDYKTVLDSAYLEVSLQQIVEFSCDSYSMSKKLNAFPAHQSHNTTQVQHSRYLCFIKGKLCTFWYSNVRVHVHV